ncbi:Myeloid differentiation primary response protein MyD88 [Mizuhopecten yessoensis]|uniref:Myeloid differentiation primary response protein MyD88 n=1 Tax=Mizuhopecten yessoensis TaxID=6573 RepID=A0A210R523_MIZYE|nr:Myeloid differentiation primary response protein MyD88 [Mizuhopecten yessoensis]
MSFHPETYTSLFEPRRQVKDVEAFLRNKERQQDMIQPVQSNDVSQSSDHHVDEGVFLCKGDVENKAPQFFDAFVSYNHDGEDIRFVKDMIKILEGEPHKLKLFIPGRDDLPGAAKYVMDARLIETRCRRMVIILSNNYLLSSACDFQSKFAHALAPGARNKKLIPVIIEPVTAIPEILRYVTLCDYTKVDLQEWFWNRLSSAIKLPLDPAASGWSPGSPMSSTSVGSLSSIASSPDSAIGQSLSSSSDVQMEIPSEESINSDWVDLSSEFSSQSDPEMSLSMSPPAITSSSASSSKGMKSDIKRFFGGIGKLNFGGSSNSSVKDPSPQ